MFPAALPIYSTELLMKPPLPALTHLQPVLQNISELKSKRRNSYGTAILFEQGKINKSDLFWPLGFSNGWVKLISHIQQARIIPYRPAQGKSNPDVRCWAVGLFNLNEKKKNKKKTMHHTHSSLVSPRRIDQEAQMFFSSQLLIGMLPTMARPSPSPSWMGMRAMPSTSISMEHC